MRETPGTHADPFAVSAAVLIGGHSRRMGEPKALLRLGDDGETLVERVVARLGAVTREIALVGTPGWDLPPSLAGWPLVRDRGVSAADGLIAALDAAPCRFCLVAACDTPFLDVSLLREMVDIARREGRGVIARDDRGCHPLHAVYDTTWLPELRAAVEGGARSLGALASLAGMAALDLGAPEREAQRWSVFNVNTPADLARARAHAREAG
jgi:molybdopterin-guanine dinucleotide biosynthesis protein A